MKDALSKKVLSRGSAFLPLLESLVGGLLKASGWALGLLVVVSCASKPKAPEPQPEPQPAKPTVVIKRVPEYVSDLQIEMAARDLFALAGLETRAFEFQSKGGVLQVSGTHEPSRSLNNALALLQRIKGVKVVRADIEGGTVSGTTSPPEAQTSLVVWFVRLFWPLLALIGAAFVAIGFLYWQTRLLSSQLEKKRGLKRAHAEA